jgi:ATP-dependent Clp protease protease subunit
MRKFNSEHEGILHSASHYKECYSRLAGGRVIFLTEDITREAAASFNAMLMQYDSESNENISIYINTYGGIVEALFSMYDMMNAVKSTITTICLGKAYSAGSLILAAGSKGNRLITKNSNVMIHGVQTIFPLPDKDQKDMEKGFDNLKRLNNNVLTILAKHTKKTLKTLQTDCKTDMYLDAKAALKYGIVDEII